MATLAESGRARARAPTPVTAPVRMADSRVQSITARGRPFSASFRMVRPVPLGSPKRAGLPGKPAIHLMPKVWYSPPT